MNTAVYKHVTIPTELLPVIQYMSDVEKYREELANIVSQWDLLNILGHMAGTDSDMSSTQNEFQNLSNDLLSHLGLETLKKSVQEMSSIAQVSVDILIRNLFERTADIGFLATDEDIRSFILAQQKNKNTEQDVKNLQERFKEYVAKYSVYHNIILLDPQGEVLVQLNQNSTITQSKDSLIQEALVTSAEYVEVYKHSDLDPGKDKSLIYAFRVTTTNESDSEPIGVLCLCFRFENEMESIFANLLSPEDWFVSTILDDQGTVIASSDRIQVPHGHKLEKINDREYSIVRVGGRLYLAKTCATKGYQNFMGLGWHGHVMLPIENAFNSSSHLSLFSRIDPSILEAVLKDPQLFSQDLREIPIKANTIQENLNRTVWNGNIRQTTKESKVLLSKISEAGERTKQVFNDSIANLHQTIISAILEDVRFQATLAVDIMDRNLYERANDCRWWALTSAFRSILAKPEISEDEVKTISGILKYINDLYTVYTNLFVYDTQGKIIAVSNPDEEKWVGKILKDEYVQQTLELKDSQSYVVSKFDKSNLYRDRFTYIYGAAISNAANRAEVVGGIGIVFDCEPQFFAMLEDCLPRDKEGEIPQGVFAVFCDRNQNILSSTHPKLSSGDKLKLSPHFFSYKNGDGDSTIINYEGEYFAVGIQTSAGYREYKQEDHYKNDIVALVFSPLATVIQNEVNEDSQYKAPQLDFGLTRNQETLDVATFRIGDHTYGLRISSIEKATDLVGLTQIPGCHPLLMGKIVDSDRAIPVIDFVQLSTGEKSPITENAQVVILKGSSGKFGILVDSLGPIPSIPKDKIDFNASLLDAADKFTEGVLLPSGAQSYTEMVVLLDAKRMQEHLKEIGTFDVKNLVTV